MNKQKYIQDLYKRRHEFKKCYNLEHIWYKGREWWLACLQIPIVM